MHDGVDVVLLDAAEDSGLIVDIAEDEGEVFNCIKAFGIVECGTVVELVEADDVVGLWVGECEVPDNP